MSVGFVNTQQIGKEDNKTGNLIKSVYNKEKVTDKKTTYVDRRQEDGERVNAIDGSGQGGVKLEVDKDVKMSISFRKPVEDREDMEFLKILYFNARSIKAKMEEFKLMVEEKKPSVIVIVESWLTEDILDSEIMLNNFDIIRNDRSSDKKQRGGGVLIYVKKCMNYSKVEAEKMNNLEYIWIKVHSRGCEAVCIGAFYRPPDGDEDQIKSLIKKISKNQTSRTILIGDFNCSDINWKKNVSGKKVENS
jgi:thymidylate synthase